MPFKRSRVALAALGAAALAVPLVSATADASSGARSVVPGAVPAWVAGAHSLGAAPSSTSVDIRVGLNLRDAAGAQAVAGAVSTPGSKSYGHYLSAAQFRSRFAPTSATVKAVAGYLQSQGLKVVDVPEGNGWVDARGSVASIDKAFSTSLRNFTLAGKTVRAPASTVSVPSSLSSAVSSIGGLSSTDSIVTPMNKKVLPAASAKSAPNATRPPAAQCSTYWGQHKQIVPRLNGKAGSTKVNTYFCGYGPKALRSIYGTSKTVAKGNDGHGVTVAILDAYANPTMRSDANRYSRSMGEPTFLPGQYTETTFKPFNKQTACGGEAGWNGEEALDVESVHAMAPGANIHYIGAKNCAFGLTSALNYVIQNHTADIVSNSYGNRGEHVGQSYIATSHNLYVQAASEGIGVYFSSGDDGDNVIDGLNPQPDYPASDPMVTAVGGTSEFIGKSGRRINTTGWETALNTIDYSGAQAQYQYPFPGFFYAGAGGGTSTMFAQPYYQKSAVPASLANRKGSLMRVVPDISADADPYTGFSYALTVNGTYTEGTIGGTSLACPLTAGIQALAEQHRSISIGFANPLLYSISANAFNDVHPQAPIHFASTAANYVGTFEAGDTQSTRYGYDDITGRGTPEGTTFIAAEATH